MDKLLYTSMAGAVHNNRAQSLHANNLANVNTTGFRADLAQARAMPIYGAGHPDRVFALTENPATSLREGVWEATGNPLDLAVQGKGFIAVQAPDGTEAFTRAGDLQTDALGVLRNGAGHPVVGGGGPIAVPPYESITIGADGTVSIRPQGQGPDALVLVDQIKLVAPDADEIVKGQDGLLRRRDGAIEANDPLVRVSSGFVERSNVNGVEEMISILGLARQFEVQVKMMSTADENAQSASTMLRNG